MDLDSDSKFSTTVTVYDTPKDIASLAAKDFDDATDGFGAASATPKYKANTAKTDPGSKAMTPEAIANPNIAGYSVLWGAQDTWAQLSNDKKTFECQISFKRESLVGTAAKDQFTIIEGQKANFKNSYYTNISALLFTSQQSLAFTSMALGATETVPSDASQFTKAGQTVTGVASTSHTVKMWTSATKITIEFALQTTLSSAIVGSKTLNQFTCIKFSATNYNCANVQIISDSNAVSTWSWQVYKKSWKPGGGDFTGSTNAFTAATGFGNTATYFPVLDCSGTAANPSLAVAQPTISSPNWHWNALGNKHDVYKKVFDSTIQFSVDLSSSQ